MAAGIAVNARIPERFNLALTYGFIALGVFEYVLLPRVLMPLSVWWAVLLIPCALSTTTNWSLIHEAIHGLLLQKPRTNDLAGRALSIVFGSPFAALRFAHLQHHALNGYPVDRPDHYRASEISRAKAALRFYPNLLFGIYTAELMSNFISLLPLPILRRLIRLFPKEQGSDLRAEAWLLQAARLRQLRIDSCLTLALFALAFWCYGASWWMLALAIAARGVLVSVSDNSYHYGSPLGAGPRSALNFRFSLGAGILHFNLHRVHHVHPTLPWSALPAAFRDDSESYDLGYAAAMLRQFRGPISDREYSAIS